MQREITYEFFLSTIHPEDRETMESAIGNALEQKAEFRVEVRVVAPDGKTGWMAAQGRAFFDASGKPVRMLGVARDITERHEVEQANQMLVRVAQNSPDFIGIATPDGRVLFVNEAGQALVGIESDQQATSTMIFDYLPPDEKSRFDREILPVVFSRKSWGGEVSLKHFRTGEIIPFEMRAFPICDAQGKVIAIANLSRDIRERKQREEALRKSEERFSKAFRSSPLAITISTEAEGRYLDVNEAFLHILGYQRRDVIGRTATELNFWIAPQDRLEMLRQLRASGRVTALPTQYTTSSGEIRGAEVSAELIDLEGRSCVLAITRDITETQQLEAQLRQAQKMEAIGRLAGGVAHDFNNILGVITGYSDLALLLVAADDPVNSHLKQIKKASERAALLTRQLLAFGRRQVVFPKILDLNQAVGNLIDMLRRMVGEDIALSFQPTTPIGSMDADPGQIEQVLMNLVVNARDAMPSGGKIVIATGNAEIDEPFVAQNPGSRTGHYVVLTVSDTGSGMDDNTKAQIFEPFFTTKGVGRGTGLGLSTVYGIVKQSGGNIWVYSEPGKGTRFEIYFPRVAERAEELAPYQEAAELPGGSETILLVEDDESLRALTVSVLLAAGYRVIEAKDAETALGILQVSKLF
jgi:PAS domain S-box-containing protein